MIDETRLDGLLSNAAIQLEKSAIEIQATIPFPKSQSRFAGIRWRLIAVVMAILAVAGTSKVAFAREVPVRCEVAIGEPNRIEVTKFESLNNQLLIRECLRVSLLSTPSETPIPGEIAPAFGGTSEAAINREIARQEVRFQVCRIDDGQLLVVAKNSQTHKDSTCD